MDISDPCQDHGSEPQPLLIDKKFKFYKILWNVENIYVQFCQENWEIRSPDVDGPQETKLILILRPTPNEDDTFSFLVKRSESDFGPETVWVNFYMHVAGSYVQRKCVQENKLCSLNKGDECEMTFTALDYSFVNNTLTALPAFISIQCEMIIYIHDKNAEVEACTDVGIRSLSDDMLTLYQSSRDYDIEVQIGSVLLRAHKSLLCARCETIRDLIVKHDDYGRSLDFLALNSRVDNDDAVKRVFAFLYTGDLRHTLEKPSLYIRELAMQLDIQEIKKYYTREILRFSSALDFQEFIFNWSILDFNSVLENNECLLSPVFTDCNSSRTWKLHFCSHGSEDDNYVDIFVETNEEVKSNVWLEISAIEEDESLTLINVLRCRGDGCKIFGFKEFASRNWIKSHAFRNVLNMAIKLKLSSGSYNSEIERHEFESIFADYTESSYKTFSSDMRNIFTRSFFVDTNLVAKRGVVKIHNYLLAARCKSLYDLLMSRGRGEYLVIRDMPSDILRIVVTYLYSGSIWDIKEEHKLTEVSKMAKYFNLPLLVEVCSKRLLDHAKKDYCLKCL